MFEGAGEGGMALGEGGTRAAYKLAALWAGIVQYAVYMFHVAVISYPTHW